MALKKNDSTNLGSVIEDKINQAGLDAQAEYNLPDSKDNAKYAFSVSFPKDHKALLEKHFKNLGISFSGGVRMILYKYMKENSIK